LIGSTLTPTTCGNSAMREKLKADFYCGYFMQQSNGGTEFTTSTLGRIVALGATLGIDIYAPDPGSLNRSIIVGS